MQEWGPQVKKLIEIEQATGQTPKALLDAPICYGLEREIATAYNFLAARRQMGFSANPIPLTEIESYIRIFGPIATPKEIFIELLGEMDSAYLEKLSGNKPTGKR